MPEEKRQFERLAGTFIVLDGGDGCGKSTVQQLVAQRLVQAGLNVKICKDPGGTEIGDRIRSVLLDHDLTNMSSTCETLLFMASRAQLVYEIIRPALARGDVVLCDRYVSSTCAYQGAIGAEQAKIIELANEATGGLWPNLTVIIDVPVEVGFQRIGRRVEASDGNDATMPTGRSFDAMERRPLAFHEHVRQNFINLIGNYPTPVSLIDGNRPLQDVVDAVLVQLAGLQGTPSVGVPGK